MYLTDFELKLIDDQRKVYYYCKQDLLFHIELYKIDIDGMKTGIRHNDYRYYAMRKKWAKRDLENIRFSSLRVLKYMFVYARFL